MKVQSVNSYSYYNNNCNLKGKECPKPCFQGQGSLNLGRKALKTFIPLTFLMGLAMACKKPPLPCDNCNYDNDTIVINSNSTSESSSSSSASASATVNFNITFIPDTTIHNGDTVVPIPNDTVVPGPNDTIVPGPNDTIVPGPNDTIVPGPNDTIIVPDTIKPFDFFDYEFSGYIPTGHEGDTVGFSDKVTEVQEYEGYKTVSKYNRDASSPNESVYDADVIDNFTNDKITGMSRKRVKGMVDGKPGIAEFREYTDDDTTVFKPKAVYIVPDAEAKKTDYYYSSPDNANHIVAHRTRSAHNDGNVYENWGSTKQLISYQIENTPWAEVEPWLVEGGKK